MPRLVAASALGMLVGATLLLSELRWFRRPDLVTRLRPHGPGGASATSGGPAFSSFREVLAPAAGAIGARLSAALGIEEDLATRLRRIHSPVDPASFRVRQLGWAASTFAAGALTAVATSPPLPLTLLLLVGLPMLAFLLVEQQLSAASHRWKRRVYLELPVLSEQLGMLLASGYSLGAALNRIAARGNGACARDLNDVMARVRHGLSDAEALREWAKVADVEALNRLVAVLSLNREAGDLGRLVSEEARNIRREVQRELIEQMERRAQQVWVPVTVATLVPGAVLLAVPFIEALRLFSST